MAKKRPLLDQMRENPKNDWNINDVERVCRQNGVDLRPPTNGSHYKVVSARLIPHLTVPSKRPIKAMYIKELVRMIDHHHLFAENGSD